MPKKINANQNIKRWQKTLKSHPEANFLQSPEWAITNQLIGHNIFILDLQKDIILAIAKRAKRGYYLEVPGGPLINWSDSKAIKRAFAAMRQMAGQLGCSFVRFRPQLLNTPENVKLMAKHGARPASFHLHAEHTVIVDLSQSEDDLLAKMRRQTRYEVRRSAKLGIKVECSTKPEDFQIFHQIQAETAKRQHFIPPTERDLLAYHQAFGKNAVIYTAYSAEGSVIAMGLILKHGQEVDYFEAASTDLHRHLPGAYALLWQTIKDAKKEGFQRFNLWGIAPLGQSKHRYAGVTTFKTGFGGEIVEYLPAHDIVLKGMSYRKTRAVEIIRKKIRRLS